MLGKGATLEQANADLTRYSALTPGVVVSKQKMDQVIATQGSAQAAHDQAAADLAVAKLNLERSEVRASVNGVVTNMELRPGTYLTPGKGVMACSIQTHCTSRAISRRPSCRASISAIA